MPLGDVATYQTVFWDESATGEFIETIDRDEFSDLEELSEAPEPPRLTAAQAKAQAEKERRRHLEDPDASSASDGEEDSDNSLPGPSFMAKGKSISDATRLARGLKATAAAFSSTPGERVVVAASTNTWTLFSGKYPARLISRIVMAQLTKPLVAATWNSMPLEGKEALMEEWVNELNLA